MASEPGVLSAAVVRDWAHHARVGLAAARERIDALNVFPVPDGDTGTNLLLTVESATTSVDECEAAGRASTAEAARALATGALLGARGNSGVILSQVLRGSAEVLAEVGGALDGQGIHRLLARGADLAYEAVAHPVEGTILTVIREAAEATAVQCGTALEAMDVAVAAAEDALARTPTMLEALRRAGVVDAGGQGLVIVLAALRAALTGAPVPPSGTDPLGASPGCAAAPGEPGPGPEYSGPQFEVMYLLDAEDSAIPGLREVLDALGDSLVVVGGDGLWNVHVHVDDAGAAVEAALAAGRPHRIRITHLASALPHGGAGSPDTHTRRLVAVAHGPGTRSVLEEAGVVVHTAQARVRPSTAELLAAVQQAHASEVVLLPSDSDTNAVAEIAAEEARAQGVRAVVIPTRSIVQTLAAAAVHDPDVAFEEDVIAMTRAAGATRYGAVTVASRAALTTAGPCEAGDVLGLVDGDIVVVRGDVQEAVREILVGMLAIGGDLVTVVFGADETGAHRQELVTWIERSFPLVDVVAVDGGQPLWPVIVGVE